MQIAVAQETTTFGVCIAAWFLYSWALKAAFGRTNHATMLVTRSKDGLMQLPVADKFLTTLTQRLFSRIFGLYSALTDSGSEWLKSAENKFAWIDLTNFFKEVSANSHHFRCMQFIFKICQTVAGMSMIGQFPTCFWYFLAIFFYSVQLCYGVRGTCDAKSRRPTSAATPPFMYQPHISGSLAWM